MTEEVHIGQKVENGKPAQFSTLLKGISKYSHMTDKNSVNICHSGDSDSGESPIALVEIPIRISPCGNSDPLITSLKINRYCIIMKFEWMGSKMSFIRLCKKFVE